MTVCSVTLTGVRHIGMADQKGGEHEEGKAKAVIGARLGGYNFAQVSADVLVGKGALGDGLGENGVGAGDAGTDDEGGEQRDARDRDEDTARSGEPHHSHRGEEEEAHFLPSLELVFGRQLEACNDQLDADHNPHESLFWMSTKGAQLYSFRCLGAHQFRLRTRVILLVCPSAAEPHLSGSMNLAANGPSRTPIATAGTAVDQ